MRLSKDIFAEIFLVNVIQMTTVGFTTGLISINFFVLGFRLAQLLLEGLEIEGRLLLFLLFLEFGKVETIISTCGGCSGAGCFLTLRTTQPKVG